MDLPYHICHPHSWLGVAHGKWSLSINMMVDFTAQQLAPLVICVFCSWRSRRHICMTTTVQFLHQTNLLHTNLGSSSYMVPVGLSSWGRIRRGKLVPHLWNYCPIFAIDHGATTNFLSTIPFKIFSTSAMPHQEFGRSWWLTWWCNPNLHSWGLWTHDNHSSQGRVIAYAH